MSRDLPVKDTLFLKMVYDGRGTFNELFSEIKIFVHSIFHQILTKLQYCRGAGTGGAGGAIALPTFDSQVRIHSNSTTNKFG